MSRYAFTRIRECNNYRMASRFVLKNATVSSVAYRKLTTVSVGDVIFALYSPIESFTGHAFSSRCVCVSVCVWQYTFNDIMCTVRLVRARSFHKIRDFFFIPPLLRRRTPEFRLVSMRLYVRNNNVYWSAVCIIY